MQIFNTYSLSTKKGPPTEEFTSCKIVILSAVVEQTDRLCGLVVRVPGYRLRGTGFDSRRYQIF
jgi:hypothetical protein